eukprot:6198891-Prymnesium_polylepis.1
MRPSMPEQMRRSSAIVTQISQPESDMDVSLLVEKPFFLPSPPPPPPPQCLYRPSTWPFSNSRSTSSPSRPPAARYLSESAMP